ncbi:hypothetical protein Y032_0279g1186 [Ancylostoma ceylanicum]|uniref:VWFA domain-containing protein n=1 Tax=Ancylostoma ceylanicum TaxID=53326 RepID=A0A016S809_9BILA|nr:hypothetical protein Y032_0279g1186 [Ancylostoma ceylanicum]
MCLDCDTTVEGRSIVFVMDSSGTVQDSGWEKQIGFMNTIASNIKNARTGIVKMLEPPVVSLEMGQHSKEELRIYIVLSFRTSRR